jgi:hypothetical protein
MRWAMVMIALSAPLSCSGCVALPNLAHPGSEERQQARAQVFEPYPESEPGPPVIGGRPREYQNPRAEVVRVQPRIGEPVLAPCQQALPQPQIAQPQVVTPPAEIYYPPGTSGR